MKDRIDRFYMLALLQQLLNTPSPSGYCREIMDIVGNEAMRLGYGYTVTNKGAGIITVPGRSREKRIGLSAHVDTLGAMVRSIKDNGKLRFTPIGGYMMNSIEGEYCLIHARDGNIFFGTVQTTMPSVHVFEHARELKREEPEMEIRVDADAASAEEIKALGISAGDFISFDPRVKIIDGGWIKSRHLDDKAGVAAVFGMLELFSRENIVPEWDLTVLISTYEEVGHGAAFFPAVDELIAVDMGAIGDDLSCTEKDVSICAKDSSGPYDYGMVTRLAELAEREKLPYAIDIYPRYGSDASAALKGGNDIRAALIGPGVSASHGMERTHIAALLNTAALLALYVTNTEFMQ